MRCWLAALACVALWSDFFPNPTAELRYGPGVQQGIKVEVCDVWNGKTITVWSRLYMDVADSNRITEHEISPWGQIQSTTIKPFPPDPAIPTPAIDYQNTR